jgi:basic membrane protein A and related proteins
VARRRWIAGVAAGVLGALALCAAQLGNAARHAAPLKVGLVTDIGGLNDRGFNQQGYQGLLRAEKKLGIQGKVMLSKAGSDYIPNMSALAEQGYNLVIGLGFLQESAIQAMAKKFPNTKFAGVDMNTGDFKGGITNNFEGLVFREQETGYMVGYLAGLEAKRKGFKTVSSVGGIPVPAVVRFIAGYQAGARAADPGISVVNAYSMDFTAQDKCKNIALQQIGAGAGVVFQVAGGCGLGALDAAKEKSVWGIGVDTDQGYLGSEVLTSALKKVDVAVYGAIANLKAGRFDGGKNVEFTAANGGVGLGTVSKQVPAAELAKTKAIAAQIASGKIVPPTQCSPHPNC